MKTSTLSRSALFALGILCVSGLCLSVLPGRAATLTWTGGGTDNNWSTGANWGGTPPATGDNLIFSGTSRQVNTNDLFGLTSGWLRFVNGGFELYGNGLTVSTSAAGIITNLAGINTINLSLGLPANKVWLVAAGSELRLGGPVSQSAGTAGGIIMLDGGGTVRITGAITATRGMDVTNGAVIVDGGTCDHSNDGIRIKPRAGATAEARLRNNGLWRVGGGGNFRLGQNAGAGSTCTAVVESGTLDLYGSAVSVYVGESSGAPAVFTQNGGVVWGGGTGNNDLILANAAGAEGTYNLNGGILRIRQIRQGNTGATKAEFNFNGGTLLAKSSLATFFQDVQAAYVQAGGAWIDTTNNNVTINQPLLAPPAPALSGGLIKLGSGTLTLGGASTYTGPTIVREGTLATGYGKHPPASSLSLSNGTVLTLDVTGGFASVAAPATALGADTVLNLNYGTVYGNPTLPALSDQSTVGTVLTTLGDNIVINISASGLVAGQFPLIKYAGAIGGAGFGALKLGQVPPGVIAKLVNNTANGSVDLDISLVVRALSWAGNVNGDWDINTTANWRDPFYVSSTYLEYGTTNLVGDIVTFDDTLDVAGLNTNINLTTTLHPAVVNVDNNVYDYVFGGPGKFSGETVLNKSGGAGLIINTANDHTGGAAITGGAVLVGNDAALGTGTVALGGGMVAAYGGSRTLANSFTGLGSSPANWGVTNGNLTLTGAYTSSGANDAFLYGGGDLVIKSVLSFDATGGWDIYKSRLVIDGGSATNADDGIRLHAEGTTAELVIRNNGIYEVGRRSGSPNIRLGQVAYEAGTNILRMDSGLFLMRDYAAAILVGDKTSTTGMVYQTGGTIRFLNLRSAGGVAFGSQTDAYGEYHLDGGVLETPRVYQATGAYGTFFFNGGTLRVSTNTYATTFFSPPAAVIQAGGAVIDTAGFDVTVVTGLSGVGGLTKVGLGTLTLGGASSYAGPTLVTEGKLVLGVNHASSTGITVSDGATLGLSVATAGTTVQISSATLGNGGTATLEALFDGGQGNPTAPAGHFNSLTLNGTVKVSVAAAGLTPGQFPVIHYGALVGSGSFVVGQLPQGVVASIVTNTVASTLDLVVSEVAPLVWSAAESFSWDLTSTNWLLKGSPARFEQGDAVLFDDTAASPGVSLALSLAPSGVVVSNSILDYVFLGSGSLSGSMSLVKDGTGTLTLNTSNSFSGTVTIKQGTIVAGNNAALGSTAGATLVENGATLDGNAKNLGLEPLILQGAGVGGRGALVNGTTDQNDTSRNVTLAGDTVIRTEATLGIRTSQDSDPGLRGNGYKLTKLGAGAVNLNGGSNVSGITNYWDPDLGDIEIIEGQLSFQRRINLGRPANTVTVHTNGVLHFYSLTTETPPVKNVQLNSGMIACGGGATGDINAFGGPIYIASGSNVLRAVAGTILKLSGSITGPGNLHCVSAAGSIVALGASSTHSGITEVASGTLMLDPGGALAATPEIRVRSGATFDVTAVAPWVLGASQTLTGSGAVNGSVVANGTVSPGTSIGTLTFNNDLTLGGVTVMEVTKDTGLASDGVVVNGSLTYGGKLEVVLAGTVPLAVNDTFQLFNAPFGLSGSFSQIVLPPAYTWDTSQLGVDGTIRVIGVAAPPQITTVTVAGGTVTLSGSGGTPGGTYYVLSSTNVGLPLASWTALITNLFDGTGKFTYSMPVNPGEPQRFFRLQMP